jgi:hypothetical protein
MVSQWHYSLHTKYLFSSNAIYRNTSRGAIVLPWERQVLGERNHLFFLYIWNQTCFIQYPVLHKFYTAWFSLVRLFLFSQVWQNYLSVRKFISEILKKKYIAMLIYVKIFWGKPYCNNCLQLFIECK